MTNCQNLYILSTIACKLAECMPEEELEVLAADLSTLGDMISGILARKALCESICQNTVQNSEKEAVGE